MNDSSDTESLLANPETPAGEPQRAMRLAIMEGLSSTLHLSLTGGALLTAYALMLGANEFHLGLLSAMEAFATVGSLLGAQLIGRVGCRKRLLVPAALLYRLPFVLLITVPFLPVLPGWRLAAFLGIVLFTNVLQNMANNLWLSWMTDLVPLDRQGRYFSRRNVICSVFAMVGTFGVGSLYDFLKARFDPALAFVPLFAGAVVFAILSAKALETQWEPPLKGEKPISLADTFRIPFANRNFRGYLGFLIPWCLINAIAGPFYYAHLIKNLHMSLQLLSLYPIFSSINLVTQLLWGRVIDRIGNRPVMLFNMGVIFILPMLWVFATPAFLLPIWVDAVLTGIFKPGIELTLFNFNLNAAPRESRASFFAVQSIVVGIAVSLGSLLGGGLAYHLRDLHFQIGKLTIVNFHVLFLLVGTGRLLMMVPARHLREEKARPVGVLVGMIAGRLQSIVGGTLQIGMTSVRMGMAAMRAMAATDAEHPDRKPGSFRLKGPGESKE